MKLVATKLGWVNVESGELVQRIFGLSGAREWDPETNSFDPPLEGSKKEVPEVPVAEKPAKKKKKVKEE